MECSVCQSTNLVKVSLAYEQGLSEYKGKSRSHGLSLGTGGLGLWGGSARKTGAFQTRLSARLSPPVKRSYWKTFKWWLAGLVILWFVGIAVQENAHNANEFSHAFNYSMDVYAAALVILWALIWRFNRSVFPVRRRRWDRSFMCRRCGETMEIPARRTLPRSEAVTQFRVTGF
ncbi:MAG: hypothetical protein ACLQVL_27665 [Terriglobia bacterium]